MAGGADLLLPNATRSDDAGRAGAGTAEVVGAIGVTIRETMKITHFIKCCICPWRQGDGSVSRGAARATDGWDQQRVAVRREIRRSNAIRTGETR
jgi:hypothetical protein